MFSEGTGREDPFHSAVISPDISDKDQMADCHLWAQFLLPSVLSLIYPQFSASHSGLPQFPYTFWFLPYYHIDKDILPSLFLFPPTIFLVPIYHRWKRNTNAILSSSTYLVPQDCMGKSCTYRAHTWEFTLIFTMHSELAQPVLEEHEIALPNLFLFWVVGSTSVPECDGSTWRNLLPWDVGCS